MTERYSQPEQDRPLFELLSHLFAGPLFKVEWAGAFVGHRTDTVAEAARAIGIENESQIAKTIIFRWKLSAHSTWNLGTAFLSGRVRLSVEELQHALHVFAVEVPELKTVQNETGFEPGATPPLVLPAVVHTSLLKPPPELDGRVYISGLSQRGLYRLSASEERLSVTEIGLAPAPIKPQSPNPRPTRNELIFRQLLGDFDSFGGLATRFGLGSEIPDWYTLDSPFVSRLSESIYAAILPSDAELEEAFQLIDDDDSSIHSQASLTDARVLQGLFRSAGQDAPTDLQYWEHEKTQQQPGGYGHNLYFARFLEKLQEVSLRQPVPAASFRHQLAATNWLLAAKIGLSTRFLFPMALTVYERVFFPFLSILGKEKYAAIKYGPWGASDNLAAGLNRNLAEHIRWFMAKREMLKYCRLTQYTQLDISHEGGPLRESKSQTGKVLREGSLYTPFDDIVVNRRNAESAGEAIDDELGLRSNAYLRLYPHEPPPQDKINSDPLRREYMPRLYLFQYSPYSNWFFPRKDSRKLKEAARWLQMRLMPVTSGFLMWNTSEFQKRVESVHFQDPFVRRAPMETDLQRQLQATNRLAGHRHEPWFRIMTSYAPSRCTVYEIITQYGASPHALSFGSGVLPTQIERDYPICTDVGCMAHVLEFLLANAADHIRTRGYEDVRVQIGYWPEENSPFFAVRSRVMDGDLPQIAKYQQILQRSPLPYFREKGAPYRGLGLSMLHLALDSITMSARASGAFDEVFATAGLKREPSDDCVASRRPSAIENGKLSSTIVDDLWTWWEVRVCFSEIK